VSRNDATKMSLNGPPPLPPEEIIFGRSAPMQEIRKKLEKFCNTNVSVLIQGEGGSGKEILARWVHSKSPWCSGPFVKVNCAAIPSSLLESELFGYQKGAFTGALASKPGRVELAQNGTLFLDEIAELDHALQAKLLQFLQDGCFSPIGDYCEHRVEARVICATIRNLEKEIESGRFRPDLLYRINVVQIHMPRLSERREDVLPLAEYFVAYYNAMYERSTPALPDELVQLIQARYWPGNIRELENRVARYVILGADDDFEQKSAMRKSFPAAIPTALDGSVPLKRIAKQAVREMERNLILSVLQANHWNRRRTAEVLKISYRALIYKIREAGLAQRAGRRARLGKPTNSSPNLSPAPARGE
jgi:two-component system, NtrC family, response regulator AtoC